MPKAKLSPGDVQRIVQWTAEGLQTQAIVDRFRDEHGVEITPRGVRYQRQRNKKAIAEARQGALVEAASLGFASRHQRIAALQKNAELFARRVNGGVESARELKDLSAELRALLSQIADEVAMLGDGDGKNPAKARGQFIESILADPEATKHAVGLAHRLHGEPGAPGSLPSDFSDLSDAELTEVIAKGSNEDELERMIKSNQRALARLQEKRQKEEQAEAERQAAAEEQPEPERTMDPIPEAEVEPEPEALAEEPEPQPEPEPERIPEHHIVWSSTDRW